MEIASLLPLSLSDDPGRVSAVLFTAGCNFRCPFCHNAELVLPERVQAMTPIPTTEVLGEIEKRAAFLDGVVISGGEPTLQTDLADVVQQLWRLGLHVKLDTNGSRPDVLRRLLDAGGVDYVAMDLKAPPDRYARYAGVDVDPALIEESIKLIRSTAPDYEFRTTVAPGLEAADLRALARRIRGARRYILQPFRVPSEKRLVDPTWEERPALSANQLNLVWSEIAGCVRGGGVRG